jgi:hypothetical protein
MLRSLALWLSAFAVALGGPAAALAASPHSAGGDPSHGKPASKPPKPQSPGQQKQAGSAHGIVQSATAGAVVVKELDGSTVSVPVGPSTHVFVDGLRATVSGIQPGFVASATWKAGKAADELLVFDPSATVAVVQSVSTRAVVVTTAAGKTVTVHVTPKTRVLVDGDPASLHSVAAGYTLVLGATRPGAKPAAELSFLRPS